MAGGEELTNEATFVRALDVLFAHEGVDSDHPEDPGGATRYGISLAFLRALGDRDGDGWADGDLDRDGDVDAADIRRLSKADAAQLYRTQFWDRYGYARFPYSLALRVFSFSVNMGPRNAHRCLQRAVRAAGGTKLVEDGILGPLTRAGVAERPIDHLVAALRAEAAGHYRLLVARNRYRRAADGQLKDLSVFLEGWLNRAYY